MKETRTLIDVTEDWATDGIFETLDAWAPWADDATATPAALNLAYYGGHSGGKPISPLVSRLLGAGTKLTAANLTSLSTVTRARFGQSWAKLWATLSFDYNPISNYDMTETESRETTDAGTTSKTGTAERTRTDNLTHTRTDNLSEDSTTETEGTQTGTNGVYGVNSATAVPSEEQSGTNNTEASFSRTNTGTQTDTETGTQTHEDETTESVADSREGTEERTLTRSGNIGVTTTQDMIQSERALWIWNYFDKVFEDLDKVLAVSVY